RQHSNRVEIASSVRGCTLPNFGGRIPGSSGQSRSSSAASAHSGVRDLHYTTGTQKNVSRLEVPVDLGVAMQMREPTQDAGQHASHFIRGLWLPHFLRPV